MNERVKGLSQNNVVTYHGAFLSGYTEMDLPFLVGIRRIPAYHVDYTTAYKTHNQHNTTLKF